MRRAASPCALTRFHPGSRCRKVRTQLRFQDFSLIPASGYVPSCSTLASNEKCVVEESGFPHTCSFCFCLQTSLPKRRTARFRRGSEISGLLNPIFILLRETRQEGAGAILNRMRVCRTSEDHCIRLPGAARLKVQQQRVLLPCVLEQYLFPEDCSPCNPRGKCGPQGRVVLAPEGPWSFALQVLLHWKKSGQKKQTCYVRTACVSLRIDEHCAPSPAIHRLPRESIWGSLLFLST